MAHNLDILQTYNTRFGSSGFDNKYFDTGDPGSLSLWNDAVIANDLTVQDVLTATANGTLLIGDLVSQTFIEAVPTGTNGVTITAGGGTLAFGMSVNGFAKSVEINLASGTTDTVELFTPDVACTIVSCYLIFSVASGSTPASIQIGNSGGAIDTYLASHSTNTSAALFSKQSLTMLTNVIGANTTVYLTSDGAGDSGKVFVYLKFKLT